MTTLLTRTEDNVLVCYFQDVRIIDESRIESLGQELTELVNKTIDRKIIVNFQNVGFMSSAMLGKLIQFGKKCSTANVDLRLCGINENIRQVFKLMNLEKVFKLESDEDAAFKSLTGKSRQR